MSLMRWTAPIDRWMTSSGGRALFLSPSPPLSPLGSVSFPSHPLRSLSVLRRRRLWLGILPRLQIAAACGFSSYPNSRGRGFHAPIFLIPSLFPLLYRKLSFHNLFSYYTRCIHRPFKNSMTSSSAYIHEIFIPSSSLKNGEGYFFSCLSKDVFFLPSIGCCNVGGRMSEFMRERDREKHFFCHWIERNISIFFSWLGFPHIQCPKL